MGSGLEIMLDIQQEEYLPIWRETSMPGKGLGPTWGAPAWALCRGWVSFLLILFKFLHYFLCFEKDSIYLFECVSERQHSPEGEAEGGGEADPPEWGA